MNLSATYRQQLAAHGDVVRRMSDLEGPVVAAIEMVTACFREGGKVLLAGNGGSAADAQHWAAEWVIRLNPKLDRPGMPAIALSTDSSVLTAGANDLGYDRVFARQVEALGTKGDLLIAISTSGNSSNLMQAAEIAHSQGMKVLGVLGRDGGSLARVCDHAVIVPADDTQRIQEMHSFIGHLLCLGSEEALYGGQV